MSDRHLVNTLRMLRRVHGATISMAWMGAATLRGEMAQYYAEQDIARLEEMESTHPLWSKLEAEAAKRGLKWRT